MTDLVKAASEFEASASAGNKLKEDALLMSTDLEQGILAAPHCLQIMIEICKISAENR